MVYKLWYTSLRLYGLEYSTTTIDFLEGILLANMRGETFYQTKYYK